MALHKDDVEQGHIVHVQGRDEFFKVDQIVGDKKIKGRRVTPDHDPDPEDEEMISLRNCDKCLSTHQFGQYKRFKSGGTGFKKHGRKLKHQRMDLNAREFILGEMDAREFLTEDSDNK